MRSSLRWLHNKEMELSGDDLLKLIGSFCGITYTVIFGIVAKKVWDVPKTVEAALEEYSKKFDKRLERMDAESVMAHRRLNVHDRIGSKVIQKDFDSRAIAETGAYPEFRRRAE